MACGPRLIVALSLLRRNVGTRRVLLGSHVQTEQSEEELLGMEVAARVTANAAVEAVAEQVAFRAIAAAVAEESADQVTAAAIADAELGAAVALRALTAAVGAAEVATAEAATPANNPPRSSQQLPQPPRLPRRVFTHTWKRDAEGSLIVPVGAQVEVIAERDPGGWWLGEIDGKQEWFPSSFTQPDEHTRSIPAAVAAADVARICSDLAVASSAHNSAAAPCSDPKGANPSAKSAPTESLPQMLARLEAISSSLNFQSRVAAQPARVTRISTHAWSSAMNGDDVGKLSFPIGARIEVVEEREPGGWWLGETDGTQGWFPSSYTKPVTPRSAWAGAVADVTGTYPELQA